MDIATIIGIAGGMVCVVMSVLTSGGQLSGIWDLPSFIFVILGSWFALFISYPLKSVIGIFKIIPKCFKVPTYNEKTLIQDMVNLSEKCRRDGILSLEEGLDDLSDEFLKTGLRLVIDGTDVAIIKNMLDSELNQLEERHLNWINILVQWAGLGPGFGMMGTVIGLIGMLNNLEDKSSLGPNMAVALVTTLYGSLLANMFMTPMSTKLTGQHAQEVKNKEMIIEGILSIQAGENPRILAMKLLTFLDPKTRKAIESDIIKD